jgi:hypothetical protein
MICYPLHPWKRITLWLPPPLMAFPSTASDTALRFSVSSFLLLKTLYLVKLTTKNMELRIHKIVKNTGKGQVLFFKEAPELEEFF